MRCASSRGLVCANEAGSLREERDGSWLGPLIKFALVVGVILLVLSLVAHILHFLFVVAIVWLVCSIALGAYRAGRRRGP